MITAYNRRGWSAQQIARVARENYGNLRRMFIHMGWPERGRAIMPAAHRRISETYGSIEAFVDQHPTNQQEKTK